MCVICQKIYPENTQRASANVIQPTAPAAPASIPSAQPSLPALASTAGMIGQSPKDVLERAYGTLANELLRLTESLSRYDTASKEYDDCLHRVQRVVETMHSMRK
jgi:hypothetical protein